MAELAAGDRFAGYMIEGVAGRGGMGVVYRATQERPRRTIALKVIAENLAADPVFRKRFERESDIAASIEHPNVIPVYGAGEEDGRVYIAMRYVEGTDLRTAIAREGRLPPQRAVRIIAQLAAALDAAHGRGLVHRDIKPANVLLAGGGDDEHAYLTDFGVSKHMESKTGITQKGAFVGTVDYIAPEQVETGQADARSDIYSLGCMLYEAITGQVPFPREVEAAKLYAHLQDTPTPASQFSPGLPPELERVIERAMAKSPDERYLSAGDFARAVNAAIQGHAVTRTERSVATGAAAPTDVRAVPARGHTARTDPEHAVPTQPGDQTRPGAHADATRAHGSAAGAPPVSAHPGSRRRWLWPAIAVAVIAVAAIAGLVLGGGSDDEAAAPPSDAQVRGLLESYSARYTADDIGDLASLLAPDLKRYVAGNPPQTRDEAIANFQQQLDQVKEPRYTFDAPIRLRTEDEHVIASTRYRIEDRSSPRQVQGVVATGAISFSVRQDGDKLLIDEIHLAPDMLLGYVLQDSAAPLDVTATASVRSASIARPASTGPVQGGRNRTVIASKTFTLERGGAHLLELPLNAAGSRGLRWGTRFSVEYRVGGRVINRSSAVFTRRGYIFREHP